MSSTRDQVFIFWGLLDVYHLLAYAVASLWLGRIPYYADFLSAADALHGWSQAATGAASAYAVMAPVWLLEASILASAVMLLTGHARAPLLCYAQMPFRLVCAMPSVPVLPAVAGLPFLALLLLSEAAKGYTLWRYGSQASSP